MKWHEEEILRLRKWKQGTPFVKNHIKKKKPFYLYLETNYQKVGSLQNLTGQTLMEPSMNCVGGYNTFL